MESAYTLASRELGKIREKNEAEQNRRLMEVISAYPDISIINARLRSCGTALARCILEKNENYEKIKEDIQMLQKQKRNILKTAGYGEDYLDDIYSCPLCKDKGFDSKGSRCKCHKHLISKYVGINSNLTSYMIEQTFDKVDYGLFASQPKEKGVFPLNFMKKAVSVAESFANNFDETHDNLLFMGNAGTGKTFLSSCIANRALERGKTVYYQTAFQLFDTLEKLKFGKLDGEKTEQAEYLAEYIYNADLLIIDDLGTEFITSYSASALFDLINTRLIHEKSTIISTNLNIEDLNRIYSQRFVSRVIGTYISMPFVGRDLRMQKYIKE